MDYNPTLWVPGAAPYVNAANLNKMEAGIAAANPKIYTALSGVNGPQNVQDGQEILLRPDPAVSTLWRMRYNAAVGGAYKWEFIGGGPLYKVSAGGGNINIGGGIATATYYPLNFGPQFTVPFAGYYEIDGSGDIQNQGGGSNVDVVLVLWTRLTGSAFGHTGWQNTYGTWAGSTVRFYDYATKAYAVGEQVCTAWLQYSTTNGGWAVFQHLGFFRILPIRLG